MDRPGIRSQGMSLDEICKRAYECCDLSVVGWSCDEKVFVRRGAFTLSDVCLLRCLL